jgi:predicted TIM-barrel fold metal-dependent hydrolase
MPAPHRIDTHHHIFPTRYMEKERERVLGVAHRLGSEILKWTPAGAVEAMDRAGIATAVTSISSPGVWFGEARAARELARECNEYASRMAQDHKGRFGVFAALPLPDVEGSLREIEHAFDALHADGVGLMTNYGDVWPGDEKLAPVFDELDRRRAVVYFHPTAANACTNLLPGIPAATIEFPFDTTRAITSLLVGGTLSRCRNIRFIFSHAGGTLPMLAHRIAGLMRVRPDLLEKLPQGVAHEFTRLHYDVCSATAAIPFNAIRQLSGISQLLYGTDFPYWPTETTGAGLAQLGLSSTDLRAVERDNALRLMPQLASR